jgi:hypothetical protein
MQIRKRPLELADLGRGVSLCPSLSFSQAPKARVLRSTEYVTLQNSAPASVRPFLTTKLFVELCTNSLSECWFDTLLQTLQTLSDCAAFVSQVLGADPGRVGFVTAENLLEWIRCVAQDIDFASDAADDDDRYLERYAVFVCC